MKKLYLISCISLILSIACILMTGCSEEKPDLKVGDTGEYEYEGVTFSYEIKDKGACITKVTPDSGEKLVFPQKIGDYTVYTVYYSCELKYKEIKFNGIDNCIKGNSVTEKIEFYKDAELEKGLFFFRNRNMKNLKEIYLPDGITEIDGSIFKDYDKLEKINLANVTNIKLYAFSGCSSLQSIDLSNVTRIGECAFSGCSSLNCDLNFNNLDILGYHAFKECEGLNGKNIVFNKKPSEIGIMYDGGPFAGLDVNIVGDKIDELLAKRLKCQEWGSILSVDTDTGKIYMDTDFPSDEKCSSPDLENKIYEYFDGREVKNGESIHIGDLMGIFNEINEDDNVFYKGPYGLGAIKYLFAEKLSQLLQGKDLDKEVIYDEYDFDGDGVYEKYNERYLYSPLDENMDIVNTQYKEVCFYIYKDSDDGDYSLCYILL